MSSVGFAGACPLMVMQIRDSRVVSRGVFVLPWDIGPGNMQFSKCPEPQKCHSGPLCTGFIRGNLQVL